MEVPPKDKIQSTLLTKCNFSFKNKINFQLKIHKAFWTHFYSLSNTDLVFN